MMTLLTLILCISNCGYSLLDLLNLTQLGGEPFTMMLLMGLACAWHAHKNLGIIGTKVFRIVMLLFYLQWVGNGILISPNTGAQYTTYPKYVALGTELIEKSGLIMEYLQQREYRLTFNKLRQGKDDAGTVGDVMQLSDLRVSIFVMLLFFLQWTWNGKRISQYTGAQYMVYSKYVALGTELIENVEIIMECLRSGISG